MFMRKYKVQVVSSSKTQQETQSLKELLTKQASTVYADLKHGQNK